MPFSLFVLAVNTQRLLDATNLKSLESEVMLDQAMKKLCLVMSQLPMYDQLGLTLLLHLIEERTLVFTAAAAAAIKSFA